MINTDGFDPTTGEWNDSLTGDFLWGNANIGEALSFIMTPYTWSVIGNAYQAMNVLPGYYPVGNIGGRPYQNATVMVSAFQALGKNLDDLFREMGGVERPPQGLTIPTIPVSLSSKLLVLFHGVRIQFQERSALRRLPRFLAESRGRCDDMCRRSQAARTAQDLLSLWSEIEALADWAFWSVVGTAWHYAEVIGPLRRRLEVLVGEADAHALLSGVSTDSELLASLGPVVGLSRLVHGKISRRQYLAEYGHRGPYETEFSVPRPVEDPAWLDQQIAQFTDSDVDVDDLLATQQAEFEAAWHRFQSGHPHEVESLHQRLQAAAEVIRIREAARSELARQVWAGRVWALRAAELAELGDDLFFLLSTEVLDLLSGRNVPLETLPGRRATYERYQALPPYPQTISGQFDPFAWAADPDRRTDLYDSHVPADSIESPSALPHIIKGIAGSAGLVEGRVRRIDQPEDGDQLLEDEVLVTSQTNIGWTLLFPRLAAVVTDVGAPLSHAAIVARELGIPAVVGCGDATARLNTGDRVRVDGAKGIVERLNAL